MNYVGRFLIFFTVYFTLTIIINKIKGQDFRKNTKNIAFSSIIISFIYVTVTMILGI